MICYAHVNANDGSNSEQMWKGNEPALVSVKICMEDMYGEHDYVDKNRYLIDLNIKLENTK